MLVNGKGLILMFSVRPLVNWSEWDVLLVSTSDFFSSLSSHLTSRGGMETVLVASFLGIFGPLVCQENQTSPLGTVSGHK